MLTAIVLVMALFAAAIIIPVADAYYVTAEAMQNEAADIRNYMLAFSFWPLTAGSAFLLVACAPVALLWAAGEVLGAWLYSRDWQKKHKDCK